MKLKIIIEKSNDKLNITVVDAASLVGGKSPVK